MPDFILEPEERERLSTPAARVVTTGLAPTADAPTTRTKERPACYVPCPICAAPVLRGKTRQGGVLLLDVEEDRTWCVIWANGAAMPELVQSASYPTHRCMRHQDNVLATKEKAP